MTAPTTAARPTRSAERMPRALGGSLRVIWVVLRVVLVLGAIVLAVAWRKYDYVPVAVQTGSMSPTYPVNTLLFVHDVPDDQVRVGDVITFDPPGRVPRTTHRVAQRELYNGRWYFHTKGDANPVRDDWREPGSKEAAASASYLRGVTYVEGLAPRTEFAIPELGRLSRLGTVPHLRLVLVVIPFIVIALQLLVWIWRREDDAEEDAEATGAEATDADETEADETEADEAEAEEAPLVAQGLVEVLDIARDIDILDEPWDDVEWDELADRQAA